MNPLAQHVARNLLAANGHAETAHVFGADLVGILSHPSAAQAGRFGVILLNAGLVHRAGPYRGYVTLARALAAAGFAVLRYDQSGVGDSPILPDAAPRRRKIETDAAMALMTQHAGVDRFVLAGICSGADDAFHLAKDDPRVAGIALFDGLAYRTKAFWLKHALPRLARPSKLMRLLNRRSQVEASVEDYRDFPPQAEASEQLASLVARDVRVLFLYTSGAYSYFNHVGQLADGFGAAAREPQVTLEFWPFCDHTFYLRRDRDRMVATFVAWMQAQFPVAANR
jgi:pimeloyl-ACP methyl ester carboxylesterase